jgi:hypothetical protein
MERYHDFQLKDHYFWTDAAPAYTTKEEREAAKLKAPAPAKVEAPRYKNWNVRETDGSITYYSAQVNSKPVILDGYMI